MLYKIVGEIILDSGVGVHSVLVYVAKNSAWIVNIGRSWPDQMLFINIVTRGLSFR